MVVGERCAGISADLGPRSRTRRPPPSCIIPIEAQGTPMATAISPKATAPLAEVLARTPAATAEEIADALLEAEVRARAGSPLRRPGATYRLQLHKGFRLDDVVRIVDYLADLGITDCYLSPFLHARPGSTHGYDVFDHGRINPEIGDEAAHRRMVARLLERGMGRVLDVVPNHMGVGVHEPVLARHPRARAAGAVGAVLRHRLEPGQGRSRGPPPPADPRGPLRQGARSGPARAETRGGKLLDPLSPSPPAPGPEVVSRGSSTVAPRSSGSGSTPPTRTSPNS